MPENLVSLTMCYHNRIDKGDNIIHSELPVPRYYVEQRKKFYGK